MNTISTIICIVHFLELRAVGSYLVAADLAYDHARCLYRIRMELEPGVFSSYMSATFGADSDSTCTCACHAILILLAHTTRSSTCKRIACHGSTANVTG